MEDIIIKLFEKFLDQDVIVIKDIDDFDYAIYLRDNYPTDLSLDQLKEYSCDYAIFKNDDKWYYSVLVTYPPISRNYELIDPGGSEYIDSKESYNNKTDVLKNMILDIIRNNINEELCFLETERNYEDYLNTLKDKNK